MRVHKSFCDVKNTNNDTAIIHTPQEWSHELHQFTSCDYLLVEKDQTSQEVVIHLLVSQRFVNLKSGININIIIQTSHCVMQLLRSLCYAAIEVTVLCSY